MSRSEDPKVNAIARLILDFHWDNYRGDEVGEIEEQYADYAWDLAEQIVRATGRVSLLRAIGRGDVVHYRSPVLIQRDRGEDFQPWSARFKTVTGETFWLMERGLAELGPEIKPDEFKSPRLVQLTQKGMDVVLRRNEAAGMEPSDV